MRSYVGRDQPGEQARRDGGVDRADRRGQLFREAVLGRQVGHHRESALGSRADGEGAVVQGDALAHADQAEAARTRCGVRPRAVSAVVSHRHGDAVRTVGQLDGRVLLLLRSLLAPVLLMLSVGLRFAATLGAATLLFQHAAGNPGVNFTLPLVLFLFVVALGTDYNILSTDRIREETRRPGPARAAVARAVRHTAPAIATAGLVLAGSFATLATSPGNEQVAFAMALGIVLSALVLSLVLVPALAALLGKALWWPLRPRPDAHPERGRFTNC